MCVFGGIANGQRTEKCYLFDVIDSSWKESEPMTDVGSFSVVPEMANGRIYILGWTNTGKTMFVWDANQNTWTSEPRFTV